jgi:hypothetical protein
MRKRAERAMVRVMNFMVLEDVLVLICKKK